MRFLGKLLLSAIGLVLALGAVTTALWAWQGQPQEGRVAPRVWLDDRNIGGAGAEQLTSALDEMAANYRYEPLTIAREKRSVVIDTSEIDLAVNVPATRDAVMRQGRRGSVANRIWQWNTSFIQPRKAPVVAQHDRRLLDQILTSRDPGPRTPPEEPRIEFREGHMVALGGLDGRGLSSSTVSPRLPEALRRGTPLHLKAKPGPVHPTVGFDDAVRVAATANERLLPLTVHAGEVTTALPISTTGPWLKTAAVNYALQFEVDREAITKSLETLIPSSSRDPVEPTFTLANNVPQIVPPKNGMKCCEQSAALVLESALLNQMANRTPASTPDLPMTIVPPKDDVASFERLNIREPIGTFTTSHAPGQPRVTNIHRIADLMRGQLIRPGATLSVNSAVGPRTPAKGFVVDKVIEEGRFAESVGGGVSQFATTMFNAAFFGGMDYGEYQSHSIYVSRYPFGREATISFPHPDLQIRNPTPHGVLVWPSYTETSITVTLYSTRFSEGSQGEQTRSPAGPCTRVRTERIRRYVDGREAKDAVVALYQPGEGVRC